jgi:hypothetical protein
VLLLCQGVECRAAIAGYRIDPIPFSACRALVRALVAGLSTTAEPDLCPVRRVGRRHRRGEDEVEVFGGAAEALDAGEAVI